MIDAGWGRIVTISSSSRPVGAPRMAHYAASKGGVIWLTKALAVELARQGITVNTIAPSLVDTPMARHAEAAGDLAAPVDTIAGFVPLGRAGTPADIAAGVLVPLRRRRRLHHRPVARRERRHVHLTPWKRRPSSSATVTSYVPTILTQGGWDPTHANGGAIAGPARPGAGCGADAGADDGEPVHRRPHPARRHRAAVPGGARGGAGGQEDPGGGPPAAVGVDGVDAARVTVLRLRTPT